MIHEELSASTSTAIYHRKSAVKWRQDVLKDNKAITSLDTTDRYRFTSKTNYTVVNCVAIIHSIRTV